MNYERLGCNCKFWKEAEGDEFPCKKRKRKVICPPGPISYKCWEEAKVALKRA